MLEVGYPVDKKFPIISKFGSVRELDIDGKKETSPPHQGIDFRCPLGTDVFAVADGVVIKTGYQDEFNHKVGLGLRIMQEFSFENTRYIVCYGHNSGLLVREGDRVTKGQKIALSGMTGHAEGPHVHVQFRKLNTSEWIEANFV